MLLRRGTSLLFFIFLSIHFFSLDAGKKRDSNRPEKQYQIDGQVIIDLLGGQDIEYEALWDQYNNHEITSYELKKIIVDVLQKSSRALLTCNDVELTVDEYLEGFLKGRSLQLEQAEKRFLKNTIEKIKKEFKSQVNDECAQWNISRQWALLKSSDLFDLIGEAFAVLFEQKSDKSQLPEFMLIVSNLQMRDCTKILVHSLIKNELHQNVIARHPSDSDCNLS